MSSQTQSEEQADLEVQAQKPKNYTPSSPLIQIAHSIGIGIEKYNPISLTFDMDAQFWDGDTNKIKQIIEGSFRYSCRAENITVRPKGPNQVTIECILIEE